MNILFIPLVLIILLLIVYLVVLHSRLKNQKKITAQQMTDLKEQFYEIVHELRAPLTAVKDAAVLLNDMGGKLTPEEQTKMLSLIKTECTRSLDQVSSFLDASKVMSNKLTIQKTPNDLKNLMQEKVMIFTAQAKAAGLEMVSEIDPQLPLVMYDPKYMNQVVNNLISNSLKYTPAGGTITVSAKIEENSIVVSVYDNGMGVPDDKQKELFSKFASINNKGSEVASSGLGLYVVKGIIEAHGGHVSVDTRQGRGYKVSFTLPLQAMPASLSQAGIPAPL